MSSPPGQDTKAPSEWAWLYQMLVAWAMAVVFVVLVGAYIAYWDMRIRLLDIMFLVIYIAPVMAIIFTAVAFAIDTLIERILNLKGSKLFFLWLPAMIGVFLIALGLYLNRYADYPFKRITITKTGGFIYLDIV